MEQKKRFFTAQNIAYLSILTALVVLLQAGLGAIKVGATSFSLVLIPICLGAILLGPGAGAFLGFVFGGIVLIYGATGLDPFTFFLFTHQPLLTAAICLVKGTAAGLVAGFVFLPFRKKKTMLGVILASVSAPIVNTGLFILGALMMQGTIASLIESSGSSDTVLYFLLIGCAGINFLVEFAVNAVASPALYRVVDVVGKRMSSRNY